MARRTQVEEPGGTLLVTFVCAVLGGLAATPFWHLGPWQLALIVLLSALIGTCVAFSPLTTAEEGAEPGEYLGGARPLAGEPPTRRARSSLGTGGPRDRPRHRDGTRASERPPHRCPGTRRRRHSSRSARSAVSSGST